MRIRKNETANEMRQAVQARAGAPRRKATVAIQIALEAKRMRMPAREKLRQIAAITIARAMTQKTQRVRACPMSSWPEARMRTEVKPKRSAVWLRFKNGPKLRSFLQNGMD